MNNDMRHAATATRGALAIAFLIILAGFSAGKVQSTEPPPAPGKAIETNAATNTDDAGALLTKANACKDTMLKICSKEQYKFTAKVREVFAFLQKEQCDLPAAVIAYRLTLEGLPALLSRTEQDFKEHLKSVQTQASRENDVAGAMMAATIKAAADCIKDRKQRKQWALTLWEQAQGHEKYFGHRCRVSTNPTVPLLARLSGQKVLPPTGRQDKGSRKLPQRAGPKASMAQKPVQGHGRTRNLPAARRQKECKDPA